MKKLLLAIVALACSILVFAQGDIASMRESARKFLVAGDIDNALLVLNRAYEADKNNTDVLKDLVLTNHYKKDYNKALEYVKPLIGRADADVQSYQLAGMIYKALENPKTAEKTYKEALKKFPNSGPLYSEYGELQEQLRKTGESIKLWEKGMQAAPSYAGNYYNAALYYFNTTDDKIWAIVYGEIYANMDGLSPRANIIKRLVLDAYKQKLFASHDLAKEAASVKNPFARAVMETFAKQSGITAQGLNPETLAMIRTRFILDWNNSFAKKIPFRLFEYHQQLMKEGLFDAYNQWMFGPVDNVAAFENWVNTNKEIYDKFTQFHTSRVFKMPEGQVYSVK